MSPAWTFPKSSQIFTPGILILLVSEVIDSLEDFDIYEEPDISEGIDILEGFDIYVDRGC